MTLPDLIYRHAGDDYVHVELFESVDYDADDIDPDHIDLHVADDESWVVARLDRATAADLARFLSRFAVGAAASVEGEQQ